MRSPSMPCEMPRVGWVWFASSLIWHEMMIFSAKIRENDNNRKAPNKINMPENQNNMTAYVLMDA